MSLVDCGSEFQRHGAVKWNALDPTVERWAGGEMSSMEEKKQSIYDGVKGWKIEMIHGGARLWRFEDKEENLYLRQ